MVNSFLEPGMMIRNFVSTEEVLRVLNRQPPRPASYIRFVEAYWKATYPDASAEQAAAFSADLRAWPQQPPLTRVESFRRNYLMQAPRFQPPAATPDQGWHLPDTISRKTSRLIADGLISAELRRLLDSWLDSGRERQGREWPSRRELRKTPYAWQAASDFIEQSPPGLQLALDAGGFELVIAERHWGRPWAPDFFRAQELEACRLFVGILASSWHTRLGKCRYGACGRYFIATRVRQVYQHGMFCCDEHRQHASAVGLTKARRREGKARLIELAAQWLCQRKASGWQTDMALRGRLLNMVANQVRRNPNLRPNREPMRKNWITRNSAAIEKRRLAILGGSGLTGNVKV